MPTQHGQDVVNTPVNILIVDDSVLSTRLLMRILEGENRRFFVSHHGKDLMSLAKKMDLDVILLDAVLPEISGFDLLEALQRDEETSDIPVIMVTSLTDSKHMKLALELGAMDYIKKPVEPIEVIARVHSALRLKQKQDMLKAFAQRDGLTKLYNRTHMMKLMEAAVSDNTGIKGMCVCMMDCDYFKVVNDTFGHASGDCVLTAVANAIEKSVKSTDITGRYGGEEFCACLPNTLQAEGLVVAERIRHNVEKMNFAFCERQVAVTISAGMTYLEPKTYATAVQLVEAADKALYAAKQNGRNRVEFKDLHMPS